MTQDKTLPRGSLPPRWLLKVITRLHVALNRISGGTLFNRLGGDDVVFVTMTGAKTQREITIPLMYVPYNDGVLLVASQGGAPRNPVWHNNLLQHPEVTVVHRGRKMHLKACLARSDEKPAMWPICDQYYAPYADYRIRTDRDIPIFVCEPVASDR